MIAMRRRYVIVIFCIFVAVPLLSAGWILGDFGAGERPHVVGFADWQACVSDGACPALERKSGQPEEPVEELSYYSAQSYVVWRNATKGRSARMMTQNDLSDPRLIALFQKHRAQLIASIEEKVGEERSKEIRAAPDTIFALKTWLDGCQPAEDFVPPSPWRRQVYNLAPDGPERMDPSGLICTGDACIECLTAAIAPGNMKTRWLFAGGRYRGLGLVLMETRKIRDDRRQLGEVQDR